MRKDVRVTLAALALSAGLAGGLAGSAQAQPALPYPAPPPLRAEVIPAAPGPRYVWEPGHWHWTGAGYAWRAGHYVIRQPSYVAYAPGAWQWRGTWVWVPAHWR